MALNQFMHPRNRYKDNKPDFNKLAEKYPEFAKHVSISLTGNASLDFHDAEALRSLTCTLLKEDFDLDVELPLDRLIPTVPLRLNYIHWIEDLLQQNDCLGDVYGVDIGCGASCIYPLLGCQMNGWHFTASEKDDLGYQFACDNVTRNNLQDLIKVIPSPKDTIIQGIFKSVPQPTYHFTMCNPPFFGNIMEAQGIMSRTMDRPEPKSVSTASEVEMIYEDGGEVDFVKRMIEESLQLREQIVWYTSMLGKKSSVGILKAELQKHKIRNFTTTEFCQGRTMRWGIAWTFHDDIKVLPPSKRRKTKQRPPLVIPVPGKFVTNSVANSSSSSVGKREKVMAVAEATKQILKDLQISFAIQSSSCKVVSLECTAHTNTWANQRRKRRQRQRQKTKKLDMALDEACKVEIVNEKRPNVETTTAKTISESDTSCASNRELPTTITSTPTKISTESDVSLNCASNTELETKDTSSATKTNMESDKSRRLDTNANICIVSSDKCDSTINTSKNNHDLQTGKGADSTHDSAHENIKCDSEHDQMSDVQNEHSGAPNTLDSEQSVVEPTASILQDLSVKEPQIDFDHKDVLLENKSDVEPKVSVQQDMCVKEPSSVNFQRDSNKDEPLSKGKDNFEQNMTVTDDANENQNSYVKSQADLCEGGKTGNGDLPGNEACVKSQNCTKSPTDSNKEVNNIDHVDPLFKCSLTLKIDDDKMTIEMSFIDGSSKEAMHQVGQYIKNQLAK